MRINEQEDLLFAEWWEKRSDLVADDIVDAGSVRDILGVKN